MYNSSDTDSDSDSDSVPPPPPPPPATSSSEVSQIPPPPPQSARASFRRRFSSKDDLALSQQPTFTRTVTYDVTTDSAAAGGARHKHSSSSSLSQRQPLVGQTAVVIDALNNGDGLQLKQHLFRLTAFLQDTVSTEEFMKQRGHEVVCNVVVKQTGNTLAYGIQALRGLCRYPTGVMYTLGRDDVICHLFTILTPTCAQNVARQALALLCTLAETHQYGGFSRVDGAAVTVAGVSGSQPYIMLPSLLKEGLDLELKTNVLRFINTILMYSVGTPVEGVRRKAFRVFQINKICAELALDYAPFVEQVGVFDQFCNDNADGDVDGSTGAVTNLNAILNKENAQLQQRLKDLTDLCSQLRQQKGGLEDELKQFKRREALVSLMWDEITNLRGQLDTAVSLGYMVSPLAPARRHDAHASSSSSSRLSVTSIHSSFQSPSRDGGGGGGGVTPLIPPFRGLGVAPSTNSANTTTTTHPSTTTTTSAATTQSSSSSAVPMGLGAPPPPAMVVVKPTKPTITPAAKMKALHWKRVLVPSDAKPTIWREVQEVKVDVDELVELFAAKSVNVKGQIAASSSSSSSSSSLLRNNRHQAISIVLSKLPAVNDIVQAIMTFNSRILSTAQVHKLMSCFPSDDELSVVRDASKDGQQLDATEQFVLALANIPQVSARMACWMALLSFDEQIDDVQTPIQTMQAGFDTIKSSQRLKQCLGLLLSIGNYMNGGTNRGQADGFELAAFTRLASIKDTKTGEMSLLDYIGRTAMRIFSPTFHNELVEELSVLKQCAGFSLSALMAGTRELKERLATVKRESSLVVVATDDKNDPFGNIMAAFTKKMDTRMNELKSHAEKAHQSFIALLRFLNPAITQADINRTQSDHIIGAVWDFAKLLNHTMNRYIARQDEQKQLEKRAKYNDDMIKQLKQRK